MPNAFNNILTNRGLQIRRQRPDSKFGACGWESFCTASFYGVRIKNGTEPAFPRGRTPFSTLRPDHAFEISKNRKLLEGNSRVRVALLSKRLPVFQKKTRIRWSCSLRNGHPTVVVLVPGWLGRMVRYQFPLVVSGVLAASVNIRKACPTEGKTVRCSAKRHSTRAMVFFLLYMGQG